MRIDLNADLGESFGQWTMGNDEALLDVVTSANIACGFHAGDPTVLRATCDLAAERGVVIGAHVGYRDLAGFGRRPMAVAPRDLTNDVLYQIGALQAFASASGSRVSYVKPHGALYNTIVHDEAQASAVLEAVRLFDPGLPVLGLPGSASLRLARQLGLPAVAEAFADRAYTPAGTLAPRSEPGAVLHDPVEVAKRSVRLATEAQVVAVDGSVVPMSAASLCVHGDTPGAAALAVQVRRALEEAGVLVATFVGEPAA